MYYSDTLVSSKSQTHKITQTWTLHPCDLVGSWTSHNFDRFAERERVLAAATLPSISSSSSLSYSTYSASYILHLASCIATFTFHTSTISCSFDAKELSDTNALSWVVEVDEGEVEVVVADEEAPLVDPWRKTWFVTTWKIWVLTAFNWLTIAFHHHSIQTPRFQSLTPWKMKTSSLSKRCEKYRTGMCNYRALVSSEYRYSLSIISDP